MYLVEFHPPPPPPPHNYPFKKGRTLLLYTCKTIVCVAVDSGGMVFVMYVNIPVDTRALCNQSIIPSTHLVAGRHHMLKSTSGSSEEQ